MKSFSRFVVLAMCLWVSFVPWSPGVASSSHGLIITIGSFERADIPPLPGTQRDVSSAREIARRLGFESPGFVILQDSAATRERILYEMGRLASVVDSSKDAFIYFSGHGTRFYDPSIKNCGAEFCCREAYVPYNATNDSRSMLTVEDFGALLNKVARSARNVFFMVDSCHSAGLVYSSGTRSAKGLSKYVPKASNAYDPNNRCHATVNYSGQTVVRSGTRGRSALFESNVIQVHAASANEVAWTSSETGGLATSALLACLSGGAKDLDRSGSISLAELQVCTQENVSKHKLPPPGLPSTVGFRASQRIIFPGLEVGASGPEPPVSGTLLDEQRRQLADRQRFAQEQLEQLEAEQAEANRVAQERQRQKQAELAEQAEREKREKERVEAERLAQERQRREQAELAQRIERERERERQERERIEAERLAQEAQRRERAELAQRMERERERERQERERIEAERLAQEQQRREQVELAQRIERERERLERERIEAERLAQEAQRRERAELAQRMERERERERQERERIEAERLAQEQQRREQVELAQRIERERERLERERIEAERLAQEQQRQKQAELAEQAELERREKERLAEVESPRKPSLEPPQAEDAEKEREQRIAFLIETITEANEQLEELSRLPSTNPKLLYQEAMATLTDIHESRDSRVTVEVLGLSREQKIGQDYNFSVRSNIDGFLYVLHLGSDQKTFTLLFPNDQEDFNRIKRGFRFPLPGPTWRMTTEGPKGLTSLLVVVSEKNLGVKLLSKSVNSGFFSEKTDFSGRKNLINIFSGDGKGGWANRNRFGAELISILESP